MSARKTSPKGIKLGKNPGPKLPRHRPETYNPQIGRSICNLVAAGQTVEAAAKEHGISPSTFWDWRWKHPELAEAYAHARVERTEAWSEDLLAIADKEEDPKKADVRIKARQWVMARVNHKQWGDRKDVNTNVTALVASMTPEEKDRRINALLERMKLLAAPVIEGEATEVVEDQSVEDR